MDIYDRAYQHGGQCPGGALSTLALGGLATVVSVADSFIVDRLNSLQRMGLRLATGAAVSRPARHPEVLLAQLARLILLVVKFLELFMIYVEQSFAVFVVN